MNRRRQDSIKHLIYNSQNIIIKGTNKVKIADIDREIKGFLFHE